MNESLRVKLIVRQTPKVVTPSGSVSTDGQMFGTSSSSLRRKRGASVTVNTEEGASILKGTTLTPQIIADIDVLAPCLNPDEISQHIKTKPTTESCEERMPDLESEFDRLESIRSLDGLSERELVEAVKASDEQMLLDDEPDMMVTNSLASLPRDSHEMNNTSAEPMEVDQENVHDNKDVGSNHDDEKTADINSCKGTSDLVGALLSTVSVLPHTVIEGELISRETSSISQRRYHSREPNLEPEASDLFGSATVLNKQRISESITALCQQRLSQSHAERTTSAHSDSTAHSVDKQNERSFSPLDDSPAFMEAIKQGPSQTANNSTPPSVSAAKTDTSSVTSLRRRTTKCRFCGANLRAIDKYRPDGKLALECRNRQCLRFNGWTDDQRLIASLKRPKSKHGWFLSDPMRVYYRMRASDATSDDDDPPPVRKYVNDHALLIQCPYQTTLCKLL